MFRVLHHRSLTASAVALFFGYLAFAFLPEYGYRLQQQGSVYLVQAGVAALAGWLVCALTLAVLIRDNRSGYPAMRCSVATLIWALACFPVLFLTVIVVGGLVK